MKAHILSLIIVISFFSCDVVQKIEVPSGVGLTDSEIITGLKEALNIGTNNAVNILSKENGFYNSQLLRIPWPDDAAIVEQKLREFGFDNVVDNFIKSMNKGAEEAVKEATPIFVDAIKQMTFADARSILRGPNDAATKYFKEKTSDELFDVFKPKVQNTLDRVQVTKYWGDVMSTYNKIPFTQKVETDLAKFVTYKAMDGLFIKLAEEEKQIRLDPAARVTDILKKVFATTGK